MPLFRKKDPKDKFVRAADETLRHLGVTGSIDYDDDLFAFRMEGDRTVMLGNLFGRWQSLAAREADEYLTTALHGLLAEADQPKSLAEARDRLFPGVRDRATIESARWMAELSGSTPVGIPHRFVGTSILAVLVVDSPSTMMMVNDQHIEDWDADFDEAFAIAVANLQDSTEVARWGQVGGSVYASLWNDDYDASRLLLDATIDPLELVGDPVAFVPHRNRLIVTGADDAQGLSIAMELTERELDQPSQISAVPLVRRNGTWADFELPDDHPAAPALRRLRAADRSLAYGSTTPLIQSVVGDGTYVANSILAEKDDVIVSSATWVDGGPSIIPEVDQILFFKDQETNWMVAWHDVVAHVGDLMQPTDFYPTRFRVESFPTADQLAAMPLVEDWRQ